MCMYKSVAYGYTFKFMGIVFQLFLNVLCPEYFCLYFLLLAVSTSSLKENINQGKEF